MDDDKETKKLYLQLEEHLFKIKDSIKVKQIHDIIQKLLHRPNAPKTLLYSIVSAVRIADDAILRFSKILAKAKIETERKKLRNEAIEADKAEKLKFLAKKRA